MIRAARYLLLLVTLAAIFFACSWEEFRTGFRGAMGLPNPTPTAASTPTVKLSVVKTRRPSKKGARTKNARPEATETPEELQASPTTTPIAEEVAPPPPAEAPLEMHVSPGLSPDEMSDKRRQAERFINQANDGLSGLDRGRLSVKDAADYDRVAAFIHDAQKALSREDYLAAQGLARKAALLAQDLAARNPTY